MSRKSNIITMLKGSIIGGTMMVPGVSGGSMAMILGIYDRLVSSVSSFRKNKKENFLFLMLFVVGSGAGVLLFAKPLLALIERFPMPMLYFFIGAVAGGVPMIYKKAEIKKALPRYILYVLVGAIVVTIIQMLPTDMVSSDSMSGIFQPVILAISGIVLAVALVLPGISVSYLLLVLGLYL